MAVGRKGTEQKRPLKSKGHSEANRKMETSPQGKGNLDVFKKGTEEEEHGADV